MGNFSRTFLFSSVVFFSATHILKYLKYSSGFPDVVRQTPRQCLLYGEFQKQSVLRFFSLLRGSVVRSTCCTWSWGLETRSKHSKVRTPFNYSSMWPHILFWPVGTCTHVHTQTHAHPYTHHTQMTFKTSARRALKRGSSERGLEVQAKAKQCAVSAKRF